MSRPYLGQPGDLTASWPNPAIYLGPVYWAEVLALPEFPRLVKHFDFGPSSLGRQAYDLAAARDDPQRRQWVRWAEQYRSRRVDLVKRALPASPGADPLEVIRSWLQAGLAARRRSSAFYLARKPIVLLDPPSLRETFAWRGLDKPG